jgi:hypothetical protein
MDRTLLEYSPAMEMFETDEFEVVAHGLTGGVPPPDPAPRDYADMAKKILRKSSKGLGVVLSVVRLMPADGKMMIDTRTEKGTRRPRLKNPPAHVVMPAEIFEIKWKRMKLQYVWILSNEKSRFPVGGILFLPLEKGHIFHLVTFNVGLLEAGCTNVHHAEMQAVRWIEEQPRPWRSRVGAIAIWNLSRKTGLGYSPCNYCCSDLARFLTDLRALRSTSQATVVHASITWLTLYDKNWACGHPTDTVNLQRLARSGWELHGPGWSSRALTRPFISNKSATPVTAPPNDVNGKDRALALVGSTKSAAQLLQGWADIHRRAFAKAFADTMLELSRKNWQNRLAGLRSLSARGYKALPVPGASVGEWKRWALTQKTQYIVSIELPMDDFAKRFRWYELMLMSVLAAWILRRITKVDVDQAKAVALQQASAAGIAAAVQYVRREVKHWDTIIALIRSSGLSDNEISKRLERLGVEQLPQLSRIQIRGTSNPRR